MHEQLRILANFGGQPAKKLTRWERFKWWLALTFRWCWMAKYLKVEAEDQSQ